MAKKPEPKKKPESKKPDAKASAGRSSPAKGKAAVVAKAAPKTTSKPASQKAGKAGGPTPGGTKKSTAAPTKKAPPVASAKSKASAPAKPQSKAPSKPAAAGTVNGVAKPSKTDKKSTAQAKAEKAPKPEKKTKKKGPIDLSTAKSVAAVAAASQADSSGYVIINGRRVRMISTKGLPVPKKPKAVAEKEVEKVETQVSHIKTKLSKKELDEYKQLLLVKRRQIMGMLTGLEDEALRSSGGNLSTMPLHMADIGTDTFDQDFTLGMAQTERVLLGEINAALGRIDNKTYGVCQLTGKPIPKARLEAKPWAKYTVESAKLIERGLAPR